MDEICKKVSCGIGALKKLKPFVPLNVARTVYSSVTQPHFDYCCPVWDGVNNQ